MVVLITRGTDPDPEKWCESLRIRIQRDPQQWLWCRRQREKKNFLYTTVYEITKCRSQPNQTVGESCRGKSSVAYVKYKILNSRTVQQMVLNCKLHTHSVWEFFHMSVFPSNNTVQTCNSVFRKKALQIRFGDKGCNTRNIHQLVSWLCFKLNTEITFSLNPNRTNGWSKMTLTNGES